MLGKYLCIRRGQHIFKLQEHYKEIPNPSNGEWIPSDQIILRWSPLTPGQVRLTWMQWADIPTLIWILLKGSINGNFFSLIIFLLFCFHCCFTYLYQNFKKCKRSMPVQLNSLKQWWFLNYFSLIKLQIKISD